jgi:Holliday junction resolvase RusA-like endonuclease
MVEVATMKKKFPDLWQALGGDGWKPRRKKKEIRYGCPHCLSESSLSLKRRILRYNSYKDKIKELAEEKSFKMPGIGAGVMFYMPMPKKWSKKKKRHSHMSWHQQTPDLANLVKALEDSLMKQDKGIAFYAYQGKRWANSENGWIEITVSKTDNSGHEKI